MPRKNDETDRLLKQLREFTAVGTAVIEKLSSASADLEAVRNLRQV
jgi:hypothetical protein